MFRFPWGDMHSLNLGWFLQKFNELREDWATAEAGIDGALDAEIQKAEDALSDVFAARDAAAASASAANSSALNASQSSLASMDARDQSVAARNAAQQAAADAAASETAAGNSATAAAGSATAAAGSATAASNAATNAAGSASDAAASAASIEGDVDAAAASATAAANSETAAAGSATAAAGSASAAEQSATEAAASASAGLYAKSIIDIINEQYPSAIMPFKELATGETARGKFNKNIISTINNLAVFRTYITAETPTDLANANFINIPEGTYRVEFSLLAAENKNATFDSSTQVLEIRLENSLGETYQFNFNALGEIGEHGVYNSASRAVPAGSYACAAYMPPTAIAAEKLGNVSIAFKFIKV